MTPPSSFPLRHRLVRLLWTAVWALLARWTPPPCHAWRRLVLRAFGAKIGGHVRVHGSVAVWYPPNLIVEADALIGPGVRLYNQGHVSIGAQAVISQRAHLCASSHDIADPRFTLQLRPIHIGAKAWIAAEAFVGPGVIVGDGAVIAARAALFDAAEPWTVYRGNPAVAVKPRGWCG